MKPIACVHMDEALTCRWRYGADAGAAAENAVSAVRNSMNVYNMRPSQFIKSAALASGKATVKDYVAAQKAAGKNDPADT